MTTGPLKEFVVESLKRAEQSLQAANLLLERGLLADSVSRTYYAMFHAAVALLYHYGLKAKSHSGVINLFGEHIVKQNIMGKEAGNSLKKAFAMRQKCDYEIDVDLEHETVEALVKQAQTFVQQIKAALGGNK